MDAENRGATTNRRLHAPAGLNRVDRGRHFAAWEGPDLFSAELRAAFRSLR
jgi:hypothetical protein